MDKEFTVAKGLPYQANMDLWRSLDSTTNWHHGIRHKEREREERRRKKEAEHAKKDEL